MITAISLSLVGLTAYGIWLAFGPQNKHLDDPFDDHDD
tara:strand:- start:608 stop:721 length:114 start_codon:yes stop_codon:yes gene_type:complete